MNLFMTDDVQYMWWNHLIVETLIYSPPPKGIKARDMDALREDVWADETFWRPIGDHQSPAALAEEMPTIYDAIMIVMKNYLIEYYARLT